MFFAKAQIQSAGHAATAQDIVQQVHGQLLKMPDRVGMRPQHDMRLVGVAFVCSAIGDRRLVTGRFAIGRFAIGNRR